MKSLLIIFMLAFVGIVAHAQQDDLPITFRKHAVGINISTDVTSVFNDGPEYYNPPDNILGYGNSVAALYQYRPVKWLSMESGLEYQTNRFQRHWVYPEDVYFFAPYTGEPTITVYRLGLPINLRGYYQYKRWGVYAMAQVVVSINISRKHYFEDITHTDHLNQLERNSFDENFGLAVGVGLGVEYTINSHWMVRLEPRFRVHNLLQSEGWRNYEMFYTEFRQWSAGINLGAYYTFGKN